MIGRCPSCKGDTLRLEGPNLRVCARCGYKIEVPTFNLADKKQKCPICGKNTWQNGECSYCGATGRNN